MYAKQSSKMLRRKNKRRRCCEEKTRRARGGKPGSQEAGREARIPGRKGGRGEGAPKTTPPGEWNRIQSNSTLPHASIKSHKNRLSIIFWRCVVIFIKLNAVEDQLQSSIDLYYKASFVARCEIEI
jgi:hypothetical protein